MNLDSLNKWLALVANLGVIAGIFFLALETQQNSELIEMQVRQSRSDSGMEVFALMAGNPELSAAMAKLNAG